MVLEQPTEGFHLVTIALLGCFGKNLREDTLGKLLWVVILGLLGQFPTYLRLVKLVIDALNQHTIFFCEVTSEHYVHLVNDVREQIAFIVGATTGTWFRRGQSTRILVKLDALCFSSLNT